MEERTVRNIVKNVNLIHRKRSSITEKVADGLTTFIGSWHFIVVFVMLNSLWLTLNSYYLLFQPFDPYPFIFLNLVLAFLAALQAPIILMNQSRQDKKDRLRSDNDYRIDLHSEKMLEEINERLKKIEREMVKEE
ncbi:DUF1003 domain-containing protein [Patescibacteria group bacterium]|nr:DUF1003 domain-containing protein [Patescibacteria group bacterium]